jgi:HD-GYP domain-containing protein (c-di-GMP phosphodiesterase class II)
MRIAAGRGRMAADVLLSALAKEEPALLGHAREVADLAERVARALGLDRRARENVACAAELHDVGKMAIPAEILAKRGPLEEAERDLMRRHTLVGEAMIAAAPALRPVGLLVRASHERWDGRGYPDGLSGEAIPLGARIVAVCDAYSAMCERRPYGDVLSEADALAELRRCSGTQFDPRVVRAFCMLRGAAAVAV